MIKKIAIYDMDGTIVDSLHRYKTKNGKIDLAFWIENDTPQMIENDSLLPLAVRYQSDIENSEVFVIVATARACTIGDANYSYLYNVLGWPDKFVHRNGRDDMRGGAALKISAIKPLLTLKQFQNAAVHVYEDNIAYLHDMCHSFKDGKRNVVGHFNPSEQGH